MITAEIIADSISEAGKRITTFELEYPRFIHSELMTHRVFSRNSASSRAIPLSKMIKLVWSNPAMPVHWGRNQKGMSAKHELTGIKLKLVKKIWSVSGKVMCGFAYFLNKIGLHKQVANRILEPWSHIKVVVTSTEYDNFFYLRNHPDAQPEIQDLARKMLKKYNERAPMKLKDGEWHLPYIPTLFTNDKEQRITYASPDTFQEISLSEAKKISASLCAQISYRISDFSKEKAEDIYNRLVESKPVHASPFEHQATPFENPLKRSGNFIGWHQLRQEIKGNVFGK